VPDPQHPPVPPVSRRSQPRFRSRERRAELAAAFTAQGSDYDRLRPDYPAQAIDAILAAADLASTAGPATAADPASTVGPATPAGPATTAGPATAAIDLGAGTGKLALALAARGLRVTAVDPSAAMLEVLEAATAPCPVAAPGPAPAEVRTMRRSAEDTGLPSGAADIVTAAQAWHWFDLESAAGEARRLLRPGGVLALLWNTLDVQIPWVHRYARIMHAGDVQRDDFSPPMTSDFALLERRVVRWEDPRTTTELIDLARTRSYVITASETTRAKVLANLDWYVHEHLGHERGAVVGLPYRTDLFLYRPMD